LICLLSSIASAQTPSGLPIPEQVEIRLGKIMVPKFAALQGMTPSPQQKEIEVYLQKVGAKVAAHAHRKLPYTFHLDLDPRFKSAVALPGGQVFVGGGILALMDREDELAVVLGHEIAHIDLGQVNTRIADEMKQRHLSMDSLDKIPAEDWGTNYGKEKELACDEEGSQLAVAAGYSPQGGIRILNVFRYFAQLDPDKSAKALASLDDRVKQIEDQIRKEHWEYLTQQTPLNMPQ
jgi:predicted Zn-dependent protease